MGLMPGKPGRRRHTVTVCSITFRQVPTRGRKMLKLKEISLQPDPDQGLGFQILHLRLPIHLNPIQKTFRSISSMAVLRRITAGVVPRCKRRWGKMIECLIRDVLLLHGDLQTVDGIFTDENQQYQAVAPPCHLPLPRVKRSLAGAPPVIVLSTMLQLFVNGSK